MAPRVGPDAEQTKQIRRFETYLIIISMFGISLE